jgi:hypothetical protein
MAPTDVARSVRMGAQRLARLEAQLRRIRSVQGPPPEWTSEDWSTLAEDGIAATDEVRHQRWLVEQWRDWARADGS